MYGVYSICITIQYITEYRMTNTVEIGQAASLHRSSLEYRDPSPSITNTNATNSVSPSQMSGLYDSDEPWDEVASSSTKDKAKSNNKNNNRRSYGSSNPLLACVEDYFPGSEEPELEDGDLPSLRISSFNNSKANTSIGGRVVGGKVTRARPMSPPSKAGTI